MTVLCVLLEPWAGHRRGAAVVVDRTLAEKLEALGVLRITPTEESTEKRDEPMTADKRRKRGTR